MKKSYCGCQCTDKFVTLYLCTLQKNLYASSHDNRAYKVFDIYFSAVIILQASWEIWSLGAGTLGLADWKTPRMLIFKCSVKLTAELLYSTSAFYLFCYLFAYQYILV